MHRTPLCSSSITTLCQAEALLGGSHDPGLRSNALTAALPHHPYRVIAPGMSHDGSLTCMHAQPCMLRQAPGAAGQTLEVPNCAYLIDDLALLKLLVIQALPGAPEDYSIAVGVCLVCASLLRKVP